MDHPFTSLKILGLLDHKPRTAVELSKVVGTEQKGVLKHLAKLIRWEQVEVVEERVKPVKTGNVRMDGKAVVTPIRTRVFQTTDRGRARLEKKGGHKTLCPECAGKKK